MGSVPVWLLVWLLFWLLVVVKVRSSVSEIQRLATWRVLAAEQAS